VRFLAWFRKAHDNSKHELIVATLAILIGGDELENGHEAPL
jgi:hypothetical protein